MAALLGLTVLLGLLLGLPSAAAAAPGASTQGYQKYYAVAKSYQGKPENLAEIAGRFLGSSDRSQEIFDLNAGRKQPDGGTLTDANKLHAGWYLVLPWDAYGTGVQYGLVPTTAPAAAPTKTPSKPPASAPPVAPGGTCAAAKSATGSQGQWGALRVAPQNAWNYSRGAGVVVAVVDSGVDASLAALSGRVTVGTDIVSGTGRGDTDCLGTGTAMASIIAAGTDAGAGSVTGLAPDATILPVRLVTTDPHAKAADQIAAIEFAVNAGAKVIALGGYLTPGDATVADAIRDALTHDVVVVVAAESTAASPAPTASGAGMLLRVGSVGIDGKPASQYAPGTVDVVAPGIAVAGLGISGVGQVEVTGGQYAVAFAAGEAALIRARYPQLTAAQVVHRVEATADPLGSAGPTGQFGAGLIDPGLSVTRVLPEENPAPAPQAVVPHRSTPHPYRVEALLIVALLALITLVVLVLRARRMIRPDDPALAEAAPMPAPARTGMVAALRSRVFRLSTPDEAREGPESLESQENAAPEREEATVPVAPVTALDETPVEASVGAGRAGGSHRREPATRRLARSTTAARETVAPEKEPAGEHD